MKLSRFSAVLIVSLTVVGAARAQGWSPIKLNTGGKDLNTVYFLDGRRGWVGGDNGFLSHTEDGGLTWKPQNVGTKAAINDIYFRDEEKGFLLAGNSIFVTRDGINWSQSRIFLPDEFEGADFEFHYAASSAERMAFRADIEASDWADAANFHVGPERLDVKQLLATQDGDVHVYVCGPKRLIDAVVDAAQDLGWAAERVHREFFAGAEAPASGQDRAFEIELRSGRVISVPADRSAAQALIAAGVPLLTSCEQGVCGTCLTRVIEGVPDHKDLFMTPEEQAVNDQFTPCCSRAKTPQLVLDI